MEVEQLEIRDYLASCPPLNKLDNKVLDDITESLEITYARRGTEILKTGEENQWVYLIRTGAVEVFDINGDLFGHFGEGEYIGHRCVLNNICIERSVNAIEDSLLYLIPGALFRALADTHEEIRRYFSEHKPERLRSAIQDIRDTENNTLISTQVGELVHGAPLMLEHTTTIKEAARRMKAKTVTAMLVMEQGKLRGIVTDRAFCTKVVANELSLDAPIGDIMSSNLITIPASDPGSEALLSMARNNIRHIPVMAHDNVIGMITTTDLIRHQSHNAIYLINEIYRADNIEALHGLSRQLPGTLVSLVETSLTAYDIGHAISSVGEAITQKLLKMAEGEFGPPPVPYAWIAAGSLARDEQTTHSDQDNALILSDDYREQEHGAYFKQLGQFVNDGLNRCGYIYCPGKVMASNPKWRQPLRVWMDYFAGWVDSPEPRSLMYSSIFFDLRCLHGDKALLNQLQAAVLKKTRGNTIFLAYMAANALSFHPPLGLFRHFVMEKGGAEQKALNMKKRGVVPVVDLTRVYALSAGIHAVNTQDRLKESARTGALSEGGMADLRDAFEFISTVRLQHQAKQIRQGRQPDNFVPPEELSSLESRHLKDAFEVVRTLQESMERRYQTGRLR